MTKPIATKRFIAITDRFTGGPQSAGPVFAPSAAPGHAATSSPLELQQAAANRMLVEIVDRLLAADRAKTDAAQQLAHGHAPAPAPAPATWNPPVALGPVPIILVPPRPSRWRVRLHALLGRVMPARFAPLDAPWAA